MTTTFERFTPPTLLDSALLLAIVFGAAATVATKSWQMPLLPALPVAGETPALRVKASPQSAFAPLHLNVEVRQQLDAVAGREVCVRVAGPEDAVSCWKDERPTVFVLRSFELRGAGEYDVFAVVTGRGGRTQESNHVSVHVVDTDNQ